MFRRILVPLDGSARAEQALQLAASLARLYDSELLLVACSPPPVASEYCSAPAEYLESCAAGLGGLRVKTKIVHGNPASSILDTAELEDADLIVLTTHGRTGLSRFALGSVAAKIVRHAHCPTIVCKILNSGNPAVLSTS